MRPVRPGLNVQHSIVDSVINLRRYLMTVLACKRIEKNERKFVTGVHYKCNCISRQFSMTTLPYHKQIHVSYKPYCICDYTSVFN